MTFLDGGFGTQLIARGLRPGEIPEDWNLSRPDAVQSVHAAYVAAGAQMVYTNTFGATRLKYRGKNDLGALVAAAVANARAANPEAVVLDVGPSGRLLKPMGDLDFDAAHAAFAELVARGVKAGADAIAVETMADTRELKAAVLAAKENGGGRPVFATVALGADGKLLSGADVEAVAVLLESLHVDALGFNCGLGPAEMLPHVERLARVVRAPILVKPNAGLPRVAEGRTVFDVGPEDFARHVVKLAEAGAAYVGGCCGTTPAHVAAAVAALRDRAPCGANRAPCPATCLSSGTHVVRLVSGAGAIVGERINPTGKKRLREALRAGDVAFVQREAVAQQEAGAVALDVNCGVPGIDEPATLDAAVQAVQSVSDLPVVIDTSNPVALERALRHVDGKPLVNSVNATRASLDAVLPLAAKYGAAVVALPIDENGVPATAEGRLALIDKIAAEAEARGVRREDLVVDALAMAVSAQDGAARTTLAVVEAVTRERGLATILGVSNVSFGLPDRPALNAAMLTAAKRAGLSAAIFNPAALRANDDPAALAVLTGADAHAAAWIAAHATAPVAPAPVSAADALPPRERLAAAVRHGLKRDAEQAADDALAAGDAPLALVDGALVPALETVGTGFEKGTTFLPQLLMAADAASAAFERLRVHLARTGGDTGAKKGPIVLATVEGDVHDIGKNIVRSLLENYNFAVVDLGRDVPAERIVAAAKRTRCRLVGLSALMTTTVGAMAETTRRLHAECPDCRVTVGGAVVTADYAREIGADFYTKDAMACVRLAEKVFA